MWYCFWYGLMIGVLLLDAQKCCAQYPLKVEKIMYDSASLNRPIDTVRLENRAYIFTVKGDTNLVHWDLVKSYKLYNDPWKGIGVAYFCVNMVGGFYVLPATKLKEDKYLHGIVGYATGLAVNIVMYKITKMKWLSALTAVAASFALGAAKEYIYDRNFGGVVSVWDMLATGTGGIDGSAGALIIFGHKETQKKFYDPFKN